MDQHLTILRPREYIVEYQIMDEDNGCYARGLETVVATSEEEALQKLGASPEQQDGLQVEVLRVSVASGFNFAHRDLVP